MNEPCLNQPHTIWISKLYPVTDNNFSMIISEDMLEKIPQKAYSVVGMLKYSHDDLNTK